MEYIQLVCQINSQELVLVQEILMHELALIGYESFTETQDGLIAYIAASEFEENQLESVSLYQDMHLGDVRFSWEKIPDRNWNEEWERNFQPVFIARKCYIRSPYHKRKKNVRIEIIIEPKMSFGTGHHETTSLMVTQMLHMEFDGKTVLDMGCGTGVLGILATKLNAKHVTAIDIDEWAFQNTLENCRINQSDSIKILHGDIHSIQDMYFDIILANIDRNILLQDIPFYAKALNPEDYYC